MSDLNSKTPAGALAYCDYLISKGYATPAQVNPWRTAIQKVFETVEGGDWETLDLTSIDLDEYAIRFRTLAGAAYKAESVTAYARRVRNALDAQDHFISTGRPPSFRQRGSKVKASESEPKSGSESSVVKMESRQGHQTAAPSTPAAAAPVNMTNFPYPLGDGRMVTLTLPSRLKSDDVNRICSFIRTLQDDSPEARQIPRRTGEEQQAA